MKIARLDTTDRRPLAAARSVSRLLLPTEEVVDRSIAANSALLHQMAQSRVDLELPVATGHEAMRAACASVQALLDARDHLVRCHAQLVDVRDALSLQASDVGCVPGSAGSRQRETLRQAS